MGGGFAGVARPDVAGAVEALALLSAEKEFERFGCWAGVFWTFRLRLEGF